MNSILASLFSNIASAIREKGGTVTTANNFPQAIRNININDNIFLDQIIQRKITNIYSLNSIIASKTFQDCIYLNYIDFPNCEVIEEDAFANCTSLQNFSLPKVKCIGQCAFMNCKEITYLSLPECEKIGPAAFRNCTNLKFAYLPKVIEGQPSIGGYNYQSCTFIDCINLKEVYLPEIEELRDTFYNCQSLKKVNVQNCKILTDGVFYNCFNLSSIHFPTCEQMSQGWGTPPGAFQNCYNLQQLKFDNLHYLNDVENLFTNCYNLSQIYFKGSTIIKWDDYDEEGIKTLFKNTPYIGYSASFSGMPSIFVSPALVSLYKIDSVWSPLSEYIVPGEPKWEILDNNNIKNIILPIGKTKTIYLRGMFDEEFKDIIINCNSPNIIINNISSKLYEYIQFDIYTEVEEQDIEFTINLIFEKLEPISTQITVSTKTLQDSDWYIEELNTQYGFILNSDNYYECNNKEIYDTYSICKVNINTSQDTIMYVDCIMQGDYSGDYGILSLLNTELSYDTDKNTSYAQKVFTHSDHSDEIQTITYDVPAGEHYIYIKYIEDKYSNGSSNIDSSLKFNIRFEE